MKKRTAKYFLIEKELRKMSRIDSISAFLIRSYKTSRSLIVKKDILNMLLQIHQPKAQLISA